MAIIYYKQKLRVFDRDATKKSLFIEYGQWQFVPFWGSQKRKQVLISSCVAGVMGVFAFSSQLPTEIIWGEWPSGLRHCE